MFDYTPTEEREGEGAVPSLKGKKKRGPKREGKET